MISRNLAVGGLVATGFLSATTGANAAFTIDGVNQLVRTPFNGFPSSTLVVTDNIGTTGELSVVEGPFGPVDLDAGFAANRHNF